MYHHTGGVCRAEAGSFEHERRMAKVVAWTAAFALKDRSGSTAVCPQKLDNASSLDESHS